jgi:hypothetical protein
VLRENRVHRVADLIDLLEGDAVAAELERAVPVDGRDLADHREDRAVDLRPRIFHHLIGEAVLIGHFCSPFSRSRGISGQ